MKSTEILNKIKTFLTEDKAKETKEEIQLETKVELAQAKLENGTVVESESFKEGDEIFIVTEDEKVALPVGEYVMEDGKLLVVKEEGIIAEYREVSDEVPAEEDMAEEDEMAEEESPAEKADWAKSYEELKNKVDNLEDAIADIKERLGEKEDYKKLEDEVKQQLSETPAAEPIIHSPEVKKKFNLKYAQNRQQNSLDRVLNKMYNN